MCFVRFSSQNTEWHNLSFAEMRLHKAWQIPERFCSLQEQKKMLVSRFLSQPGLLKMAKFRVLTERRYLDGISSRKCRSPFLIVCSMFPRIKVPIPDLFVFSLLSTSPLFPSRYRLLLSLWCLQSWVCWPLIKALSALTPYIITLMFSFSASKACVISFLFYCVMN